MTRKATLHGIGEDAAQRSVHALNGVLGEWLFGFSDDGLTELRVKGGEKVDDDLLVQADFSVRRYPLLTVILYFALKACPICSSSRVAGFRLCCWSSVEGFLCWFPAAPVLFVGS